MGEWEEKEEYEREGRVAVEGSRVNGTPDYE